MKNRSARESYGTWFAPPTNQNPPTGKDYPIEGSSKGAADAVLSLNSSQSLCKPGLQTGDANHHQDPAVLFSIHLECLTHYGHRSIPSSALMYPLIQRCQDTVSKRAFGHELLLEIRICGQRSGARSRSPARRPVLFLAELRPYQEDRHV